MPAMISKLPFDEWADAIRRGEVMPDEARHELAQFEILIAFVELETDPTWGAKPLAERWQEACRKTGEEICPIPPDIQDH